MSPCSGGVTNTTLAAMSNNDAQGARLRITNADATVHSLMIPELGIRTAELGPGESVDLEIPATPEGSYEMYCGVAGHREAGMTGTLVVGDRVRIVLQNDLPQSTSLHLHGIRIPNGMFGMVTALIVEQ